MAVQRYLTDSDYDKRRSIAKTERLALINARLEHRRKRKTDECKIETVKTYLCLGGNLTLTAGATGISRNTLKVWKASQWWANLIEQFRKEERLELSAKTKRILDKSFDLLYDRLENGDFVYDPKKGEMVRKGVSAKDVHRITVDMIKQKEVLDRAMEQNEKPESHADKLEKLAEQFANLAISAVKNKDKPKVIEVTDVIFAEEQKNDAKDEGS